MRQWSIRMRPSRSADEAGYSANGPGDTCFDVPAVMTLGHGCHRTANSMSSDTLANKAMPVRMLLKTFHLASNFLRSSLTA